MNQIHLVGLGIDELQSMIQQIVAAEVSKLQETVNTEVKESEDKLLTVKEALEFLKISNTSLYNYVKKGLIKKKKVEGRVYYKKSELKGFLEEGGRHD